MRIHLRGARLRPHQGTHCDRGRLHNLNVTGCSTYAQAEEIAKEMVARALPPIELCAGFGNEGIARIKRAVGLASPWAP